MRDDISSSPLLRPEENHDLEREYTTDSSIFQDAQRARPNQETDSQLDASVNSPQDELHLEGHARSRFDANEPYPDANEQPYSRSQSEYEASAQSAPLTTPKRFGTSHGRSVADERLHHDGRNDGREEAAYATPYDQIELEPQALEENFSTTQARGEGAKQAGPRRGCCKKEEPKQCGQHEWLLAPSSHHL